MPPAVTPALPGAPALSRRDFDRLSSFIEERTGIRLPPAKRLLLESRLARRVRDLDLTFAAYCDRVLQEDPPEELIELIDRVTTNKTDFFREPYHFDLLVGEVVPALLRGAGPGRELRVWSAACASGEEPYTLAMVLAEAAARHPGLDFRVLATDLSTRVLLHGRAGVYTEEQVAAIPLELRRRWLLRSVDDRTVVRVRKALRDRVDFRRLNLLDGSYPVAQAQDVIFCRNVLIYFARSLQLEVVHRLGKALAPGGYLFLGHSESLPRELPFEQVAPTVYRRRASGEVRTR